jgi:uncharacterized protein
MSADDLAPERRMLALAREDARLSQAQLAKRAGTSQPAVAAIEIGTRGASPDLLARLFDAVGLRPSIALAVHADAVLALAAEAGLVDVRVIGSAARGDDVRDSDVDLLARSEPGSGVDVVTMLAFVPRASALLGFEVDLVLDAGGAPSTQEDPVVPLAGFTPRPRAERLRPPAALEQLTALRQLLVRLDDVTLEQLARPDGAVALRVEATLARVADAVARLPAAVRAEHDDLAAGLASARAVVRSGLDPVLSMQLLEALPAAVAELETALKSSSL